MCKEEINECLEEGDPCQNSGTCVDLIGTYECLCVEGYTDSLCQTNIDDCEGIKCENYGTCIDMFNSFRCECRGNFTGSLCEFEISFLTTGTVIEETTSESNLLAYQTSTSEEYSLVTSTDLETDKTKNHTTSPSQSRRTASEFPSLSANGTFQTKYPDTLPVSESFETQNISDTILTTESVISKVSDTYKPVTHIPTSSLASTTSATESLTVTGVSSATESLTVTVMSSEPQSQTTLKQPEETSVSEITKSSSPASILDLLSISASAETSLTQASLTSPSTKETIIPEKPVPLSVQSQMTSTSTTLPENLTLLSTSFITTHETETESQIDSMISSGDVAVGSGDYISHVTSSADTMIVDYFESATSSGETISEDLAASGDAFLTTAPAMKEPSFFGDKMLPLKDDVFSSGGVIGVEQGVEVISGDDYVRFDDFSSRDYKITGVGITESSGEGFYTQSKDTVSSGDMTTTSSTTREMKPTDYGTDSVYTDKDISCSETTIISSGDEWDSILDGAMISSGDSSGDEAAVDGIGYEIPVSSGEIINKFETDVPLSSEITLDTSVKLPTTPLPRKEKIISSGDDVLIALEGDKTVSSGDDPFEIEKGESSGELTINIAETPNITDASLPLPSDVDTTVSSGELLPDSKLFEQEEFISYREISSTPHFLKSSHTTTALSPSLYTTISDHISTSGDSIPEESLHSSGDVSSGDILHEAIRESSGESKALLISSGDDLSGDTMLSSGAILSEDAWLSSGDIVSAEIVHSSGQVLAEDEWLSSGDIMSGDIMLSSGNIVPEDTTLSSVDMSFEDTTLSSRDILSESRFVSSRDMLSPETMVSSGDVILEDIQVFSGDNLLEAPSVSSGEFMSKDTLVSSGHVLPEDTLPENTLVFSESTLPADMVSSGEYKPEDTMYMVSSGDDISEDILVSSGDDVPKDRMIPSIDILPDDTSIFSGDILSDNKMTSSGASLSEYIVMSTEPRFREDTIVSSRESLTVDTTISSRDTITEVKKGLPGNEMSENIIIASGDTLSEDTTVSSGDSLPEASVVFSGDRIPDNVAVSSGDSLYNDTTMSAGERLFKDTVDSSGHRLPEEAMVSSGDRIPENVIVSSGDSLSNDTTLSSRDSLPEYVMVSSGDRIPENVIVSSGDSLSNDTTLSSMESLFKDTVVSSGDILPEDSMISSGDKISENVAVSSGDSLSNDTTMSSSDSLPEDAMVSSGDRQLENEIVSSVDSLSKDTVVISPGDVLLDSTSKPSSKPLSEVRKGDQDWIETKGTVTGDSQMKVINYTEFNIASIGDDDIMALADTKQFKTTLQTEETTEGAKISVTSQNNTLTSEPKFSDATLSQIYATNNKLSSLLSSTALNKTKLSLDFSSAAATTSKVPVTPYELTTDADDKFIVSTDNSLLQTKKMIDSNQTAEDKRHGQIAANLSTDTTEGLSLMTTIDYSSSPHITKLGTTKHMKTGVFRPVNPWLLASRHLQKIKHKMQISKPDNITLSSVHSDMQTHQNSTISNERSTYARETEINETYVMSTQSFSNPQTREQTTEAISNAQNISEDKKEAYLEWVTSSNAKFTTVTNITTFVHSGKTSPVKTGLSLEDTEITTDSNVTKGVSSIATTMDTLDTSLGNDTIISTEDTTDAIVTSDLPSGEASIDKIVTFENITFTDIDFTTDTNVTKDVSSGIPTDTSIKGGTTSTYTTINLTDKEEYSDVYSIDETSVSFERETSPTIQQSTKVVPNATVLTKDSTKPPGTTDFLQTVSASFMSTAMKSKRHSKSPELSIFSDVSETATQSLGSTVDKTVYQISTEQSLLDTSSKDATAVGQTTKSYITGTGKFALTPESLRETGSTGVVQEYDRSTAYKSSAGAVTPKIRMIPSPPPVITAPPPYFPQDNILDSIIDTTTFSPPTLAPSASSTVSAAPIVQSTTSFIVNETETTTLTTPSFETTSLNNITQSRISNISSDFVCKQQLKWSRLKVCLKLEDDSRTTFKPEMADLIVSTNSEANETISSFRPPVTTNVTTGIPPSGTNKTDTTEAIPDTSEQLFFTKQFTSTVRPSIQLAKSTTTSFLQGYKSTTSGTDPTCAIVKYFGRFKICYKTSASQEATEQISTVPLPVSSRLSSPISTSGIIPSSKSTVNTTILTPTNPIQTSHKTSTVPFFTLVSTQTPTSTIPTPSFKIISSLKSIYTTSFLSSSTLKRQSISTQASSTTSSITAASTSPAFTTSTSQAVTSMPSSTTQSTSKLSTSTYRSTKATSTKPTSLPTSTSTSTPVSKSSTFIKRATTKFSSTQTTSSTPTPTSIPTSASAEQTFTKQSTSEPTSSSMPTSSTISSTPASSTKSTPAQTTTPSIPTSTKSTSTLHSTLTTSIPTSTQTFYYTSSLTSIPTPTPTSTANTPSTQTTNTASTSTHVPSSKIPSTSTKVVSTPTSTPSSSTPTTTLSTTPTSTKLSTLSSTHISTFSSALSPSLPSNLSQTITFSSKSPSTRVHTLDSISTTDSTHISSKSSLSSSIPANKTIIASNKTYASTLNYSTGSTLITASSLQSSTHSIPPVLSSVSTLKPLPYLRTKYLDTNTTITQKTIPPSVTQQTMSSTFREGKEEGMLIKVFTKHISTTDSTIPTIRTSPPEEHFLLPTTTKKLSIIRHVIDLTSNNTFPKPRKEISEYIRNETVVKKKAVLTFKMIKVTVVRTVSDVVDTGRRVVLQSYHRAKDIATKLTVTTYNRAKQLLKQAIHRVEALWQYCRTGINHFIVKPLLNARVYVKHRFEKAYSRLGEIFERGKQILNTTVDTVREETSNYFEDLASYYSGVYRQYTSEVKDIFDSLKIPENS